MSSKRPPLAEARREIPAERQTVVASSDPVRAMREAKMIPLDLLVPNTLFQRNQYDDLDELKNSIIAEGQLQPLVVRPTNNDLYEVIAGNRRYMAMRMGGFEVAAVIVQRMTDEQAALAAAVENFQRKDLSMIEEARMYEILIERLEITRNVPEELAKRLNRNYLRVWRVLRIAEYPELLEAVSKEQLSMTDALDQITRAANRAKMETVPTTQKFHGEKTVHTAPTLVDNAPVNYTPGHVVENLPENLNHKEAVGVIDQSYVGFMGDVTKQVQQELRVDEQQAKTEDRQLARITQAYYDNIVNPIEVVRPVWNATRPRNVPEHLRATCTQYFRDCAAELIAAAERLDNSQ